MLLRAEQRIEVAKAVIAAAIFCYVILDLAWLAPAEIPIFHRIQTALGPAWNFFSLTQNWRLFSPDVRTLNYHTVAWIGFSDGTIGSYELPRLELMNQANRYAKDRFRKWAVDCLPWQPYYGEYWPDLARYVGRLHYDPRNKPAWFMLSRFHAPIPPPDQLALRDALPAQTSLENVFFYRYEDKDLP